MSSDPPARRYCASCGAPLTGPWCAQCGEQARKPGELRLQDYFGELLEALTNLEGRFWRSMRALLFAPGRLSAEYLAGRRVAWMRPLHMFLLVNVVYFFLATVNIFSTPLLVHMTSTNFPHQTLASEWVNRRLNTTPMEKDDWQSVIGEVFRMQARGEVGNEFSPARRLQQFAGEFNQQVDVYSRTLVVLMVPLCALGLWVLLMGTGRSAVSHLVFATHWMAFMLIASVVISGVTHLIARWRYSSLNWMMLDAVDTLLLIGLAAVWTSLALRRAYDMNLATAVAAGLGLAAWFWLAVFIYRAILFFAVFVML